MVAVEAVRGDETLDMYFASTAKKTRGRDFELRLQRMGEDSKHEDKDARLHAVSVIGLEQRFCLEEEEKERLAREEDIVSLSEAKGRESPAEEF